MDILTIIGLGLGVVLGALIDYWCFLIRIKRSERRWNKRKDKPSKGIKITAGLTPECKVIN